MSMIRTELFVALTDAVIVDIEDSDALETMPFTSKPWRLSIQRSSQASQAFKAPDGFMNRTCTAS